ncbi:hypothetical protein NC653_037703 [Populus alba x Populus x berolinensis]|uniref:Uncharacterized protein n=1 Tax=Populus alba x Populus x berolinensis TaxID=444605 RepID=A0AAD6PSD1_9ROSI|nr:hypothetical protein NC653_037703 [Populus alba x Populus x berolinensis]
MQDRKFPIYFDDGFDSGEGKRSVLSNFFYLFPSSFLIYWGKKENREGKKNGEATISRLQKKNNPKDSGATPGNKRKQPPRHRPRSKQVQFRTLQRSRDTVDPEQNVRLFLALTITEQNVPCKHRMVWKLKSEASAHIKEHYENSYENIFSAKHLLSLAFSNSSCIRSSRSPYVDNRENIIELQCLSYGGISSNLIIKTSTERYCQSTIRMFPSISR